jgi:hypothetical protein
MGDINMPGEITRFDIAEYASDHRSFLDDHARLFAELHKHAELATRFAEIRFRLQNAGAATAQGVLVTLDVPPEASLVGSRGLLRRLGGEILEPKPPRPPSTGPHQRPGLQVTRRQLSRQGGPR